MARQNRPESPPKARMPAFPAWEASHYFTRFIRFPRSQQEPLHRLCMHAKALQNRQFEPNFAYMHAGTSPASYPSRSSGASSSTGTPGPSNLDFTGSFSPHQAQPGTHSRVHAPEVVQQEHQHTAALIEPAAATSGPCTKDYQYKEEFGLHTVCSLLAVRTALMEILDGMPNLVCSVASAPPRLLLPLCPCPRYPHMHAHGTCTPRFGAQ
jgi:hypothetical protein